MADPFLQGPTIAPPQIRQEPVLDITHYTSMKTIVARDEFYTPVQLQPYMYVKL